MRRGSLVGVTVIALLLTLASVGIQRVGPTQEVVGEGFCPSPDPCSIPALGGGFPFPFLIDDPEISVAGRLAWVEDDFRPGPFVLNALSYFLVGFLLLRRRRRGTGPPVYAAGRSA